MKTQERIYKGKVTGIGFHYSNTSERIGYELRFKTGSISIQTKSSLFISRGDTVFFTIKIVDNNMLIERIVKVDKPSMQKITFKQRQHNRLVEASY